MWDTLVGEAVWFETSAPAVALLLDSLDKAGDQRAAVLLLVAEILGGDALRGWLAPPDAPAAADERATRDEAVQRKAVLLAALEQGNDDARAAAAMALALLPELAADSVPALVPRAGDHAAGPVARAGALLALGRLGIGQASAEAAIAAARDRGAPAIVHGAAGMAWLRQDAKHAFAEARDQIASWLDFLPTGDADLPNTLQLPWFPRPLWYQLLRFGDSAPQGLIGLVRARGGRAVQEVGEICVALAGEQRGVLEAQLAKVLLALGGFSPEPAPRVALPEELTAEQKAMANRLADTHLLAAGGYRLPASGSARRRWLGLEASGPLEQMLVNARGQPAPVWRVWPERAHNASDFADPLDGWEALTMFAALTYPPFGRELKPEAIEAELAAVVVGDALFQRIRRMAEDLSARYAAAQRTAVTFLPNSTVSALLLLPWVRAGKPLEPAWDRLIAVDSNPHTRELLLALPANRREQVLLASLRSNPHQPGLRAQLAGRLLDLAPTRTMLAGYRAFLAELEALSAIHPQVVAEGRAAAEAIEVRDEAR